MTAVAVRPGVVDTDMQAELRRQADGGMPADQIDYYRRLKSENRLEPARGAGQGHRLAGPQRPTGLERAVYQFR